VSRDRAYLLYIRQSIANVMRLTEAGKDSFLADGDKQAAVLYYLQTLAEATGRVSPTLRAQQPHIPWDQIRGFRNRIAHEYLGIDLELIWVIIRRELESLAEAVDVLISLLPDETDEDEKA
jgi:uncharacterized protein with HEPN domain